VKENLGVDPSKAQTKVIQALGEVAAIPGGRTSVHPQGTGKTQALDEFGTNLTQLAAEKLDPVAGQQEIERAIQILGRRT